ncbi:MAG: heparan-alpha-glucosaminide N-acetyltransferase domain-containing protein [Myxococcota bacterium]|nr:heparan-alpha-glucosaminide N-acetyltransferase domain-containing protein [Myxococcota bacterium]
MTERSRIQAIDLLRGGVIALMALDHTRDFFQPAGASPESFDQTTVAFFLTRWLTHFCAPTFVFLAGVSVALYSRWRPQREALRFLVTRGLWLMLLEATWVTFSWFFNFDFVHLGVLWAIGGSMVLLGAVVWMPPRAVAVLGLGLTLVLHVVPVPADLPLFGVLCQPQGIEICGYMFHQSYAIVPWFGVIACGFGFSAWLAEPDKRRHLLWIGPTMIALFIWLRWRNSFGDPGVWHSHAGPAWHTVAHFANPSKYPPSLMFQLMTLGGALTLLPVVARWQGRSSRLLAVFGQVPMFFYLIHLPLIHLAGLVHAKLRYGAPTIPKEEPLSLALIWGAWLGLLLVLWPACRAWGGLKHRHRDRWWLSYL